MNREKIIGKQFGLLNTSLVTFTDIAVSVIIMVARVPAVVVVAIVNIDVDNADRFR